MNIKNTIQKAPLWAKITASVVILALLILLFFWVEYLIQSPKETNNINLKEMGYQEIFSRIGTIKKIGPEKIVFIARPVFNSDLKEETIMTAILSGETKYFSVQRPKIKPKDVKKGKSHSIFQRERIKLSDLKVGDRITIISSKNIWQKTEFLAKKIELLK